MSQAVKWKSYVRCVVSVEGFLMVTTVISIQVKVAAHFTKLSAPPTVHHDLLFPSLSNCLADSDAVDEQETQRGRALGS